MAKRLSIPSKHVELEIVGAHDSFIASRVQRVSTTADQATNTIDELGNPLHAGTSKDVANVTMTFQAMDVGVKVVGTLAGVSVSGWNVGSGLNVSTSLDRAYDAVIRVRDENVAQYVRASHIRRVNIQSFTYNYSVDGDSTEEYTAVGSTKRWFTNDVIIDRLIGDGTTTPDVLSETPETLKNGDETISVIVDGVYFDEVAATPGAGEFTIATTTITFGVAPTIGQVIMVIYQSANTGDAWTDVSDSDVPAAIRGKDVGVLFAGNSTLFERVQSVSVTCNFNPQPVREMGNRQIVGYLSQVPEVTGSISVLDTDDELISYLTGSSYGVDTEIEIGACGASGVALEMKLYDPSDCTDPLTVEKTVYLPDISMTSETFTANVNENAQQSVDWRSDSGAIWVYNGARP